jgi:Tfp pilus assembly protein PilF
MKTVKKWLLLVVFFVIVSGFLVWLVDPSRMHQVWGDWARKLGCYDFAIEQYSRAINLSGNRPGAFNSRGVARYHQRQYDEAISDYNRALELDPQYALAIKNRAFAFLMLGKGDQAKRDYEFACKLGRCEDFTLRCPELRSLCNTGECTGIQAAVSAGICPAQ